GKERHVFFFSSRRRHTISKRDWSSDVCSSDLGMRIAFLGGGNMASALIGGLLKKGVDASWISVIEVSPAARERLAARHGVRASRSEERRVGKECRAGGGAQQ